MRSRAMSGPDSFERYCHGLLEAQMVMMALMLFVIVVSYLMMLGLVKFAEGVIDKSLPAKLRDAAHSEANTKATSLVTTCSELSEPEMLALAISPEEEDSRIYDAFAHGLQLPRYGET